MPFILEGTYAGNHAGDCPRHCVGLANLLSYKIKFYLSKLSTLCLCTMLFCLGAKIGCDDALLAKLGTLGVQAGAIAFGAVCGSILFLSAAIKLLARPADTEEGE